MRNPWAALAGALVVVVLAAGAWRLANPTAPAGDAATPVTQRSEATEPALAADTTPAASPSPAPGETPTESTPDTTPLSPSPEGVAPPTPSPGRSPSDAPPLVGTVRLSDPAGDLVDTAGLPPATSHPAADLTEVRLDGDGQVLLVEFALAGAVPSEVGSLVWSLDIWLDETLSYTVTVQQVGTRVVSGVLDWASGEQVPVPQPPAVEGPTVSIQVPAALLGRVDGPFRWQALGQADGGYEDYAPADGVLAWFPDP